MESYHTYERRYSLRKRIIWYGKLLDLEQETKLSYFNTVNVSIGGVLIHTQAVLEPGFTLQLILFAFDIVKPKERTIKSKTKVIHINKINMQQTERNNVFREGKQVYQIGLMYQDILPDDTEFLTDLILNYGY
ncbi:hypothetical protein [Spartinivicinus poritis]|uniref:PilZ domain-containing protein n=1 Tax=Spartinivicinus poritis TaxID=2994640 RepID=A0ABT5U717_9GAMM|nr:hypothetical protein [Spartinivicinus sp. A2-2]MDE1462107.1 hypothetical protein [Spartinivicinus sp. A2-2]